MKWLRLLCLLTLLLSLLLPTLVSAKPNDDSSDRSVGADVNQSDTASSSEAVTMWVVETVDSAGGDIGCFAMNVSLSLDSTDRPHVSYYGDSVLMYAYRTNAGWEKTVVDDSENVGRSSSIAIDSSGNPHIAYRDLTKDSLKYASWDGTDWNFEVAGTAGWFPSLALDSTDQPHISYLGNEPQVQAPSYAFRVGDQWENSAIDNTFSSSGTSLALDSFERPHVVYNSYSDLNYGIYEATTWMTETVDSSNLRTPAYPSIVLDSADNPHISYQYDSDLKYAYKLEGAWQEELPDTQGEVGDYSAIALDTKEYPRISYFDANNQAIKHAQWNGSSWLVTVVDSPVAMPNGGYTSLAVDQGGNSHIFYCDGASATVRYARQVTYTHELFLPVITMSEDSPESGKIAFVVGPLDGSSSEIYTMKSIGGDEEKLTEGIQRVGAPIWSPDASKIAFEKQELTADIFVIDADGNNRVNITDHPAIDANPYWAPDSSRLVFEKWGQDSGDFLAVELYTVNADGSDLARLTDNGQMDYLPSWSPDGSKIAFEVFTEDNTAAIYVMNADGTNSRKVTDDTYGEPDERFWVLWQGEPPAWSPDSSRIAFVSNENGNMEIYTVGADGTGLTNLTQHPATDKRPRWSPDGSKIAFASDRAGGPPEIYVMNADGSNLIQLTNNAAIDSFPTWSPDGSKIAFDSDRDGSRGIYVMNFDGSGQKRISSTTHPVATLPFWSPR